MTPFASVGVGQVMRTSSFAALVLVVLIVAVLAFVLTPHERGSPSFDSATQAQPSLR